ncbi:MAG: hypothetical protein A3J28_12075 [Acidobacteria bacterium RIFCSPLOWO2_12_FULL_60_22]|nr:MAG: hypothetical protein A3J28_12075 [Acidobacteria bacterium RIFCSPLOWO2_12_FULL_60_22]
MEYRAKFFNFFNRTNFFIPEIDPLLTNGNPDANAGKITAGPRQDRLLHPVCMLSGCRAERQERL